MKPSAAAVLYLLRRRGDQGLTPAEAREWAGCDRLAARICELRAEGHDIRTGSETVNGATFARYRLHEQRPVQLSVFDPPVSACEVPPLGARTHRAAEGHASAGIR